MAANNIFLVLVCAVILLVQGKPYASNCNNDCTGKLREPVCADNNSTMVTYDNKCQLEMERCKNPSVKFVHDGECKEKCKGVKCPTGQSCIFDQDGFSYCIESDCGEMLTKDCPATNDKPNNNKVCGLDNLTYESECDLKQASCKTHQVLLKRYDGPCEAQKSCSDIQCGTGESCVTANDGAPRCIDCCRNGKKATFQLSMCGSDKKTYPSWCEMRAESCRTGKLIQFNDWICP